MRKNFLVTSLTILLALLLQNNLQAQTLAPIKINPQTQLEEDEFADFDLERKKFEIKDPFESYNRMIFAFNDSFDRYFFQYVAKTYRASLPKSVRASVRNFINNLTLPLSAINSILQGKVDNSLATMSHFVINSTIGLGGVFDVAGDKGIRYQKEDFGQTLAFYGSSAGSYLVLPFLGSSSTRDFTGSMIESAFDPMQFDVLKIGGEDGMIPADQRVFISGLTVIDKREALIDVIDDLRRESFDTYSTARSAYFQRRNMETSK